ncbi:hypothetical protein OQH60_01545 [Campylobacter sp. MIT 21-1685]|uniref:hypothetical protein n=1 Tax=unclassified Campylobacter TaxID=2593542 RepID=UPI00224AE47B|nr:MULTISPECIES: hypothetical protein [unclassified Campylobacter]MCX2682561.1 hypothetical protein [Campylobacter sp. MIT 21-1684]MCX2750726.1 hypothetical protein [Campylobacter sp. MIT 21-1682]MCX2807042.1 hypothetical protein [Campylobacter sp. MIT 21-1685]
MSLNPIQRHLDKETTINLGSFYTPKILVEKAYGLMQRHILNLPSYVFLDSSCGCGDFFIKDLVYIGADIDKNALQKVTNVKTFHTNSLFEVSRQKFTLKKDDKVIIIGNPPYNDKTSLLRADVKKDLFECDSKLKHRDLGISFLRSYAVLEPEFICVLHPLSYLIKKSNFNALFDFKKNYKLVNSLIISSAFFTPNSSTFFPIIIALYEKNACGMEYEFIQNYSFRTIEGQSFILKDFDFIGHYVNKYPNPKDTRKAIAFFHTLRDINALNRNQTFMPKQNANSIKIFQENLKYYVYIHFFKVYAKTLPYYFGNLDVFIDNEAFLQISDEFEKWFFKESFNEVKIKDYFTKLFARYVKDIK